MNLLKKKNNIKKATKIDKTNSFSILGNSPKQDWTITIMIVTIIFVGLIYWSWILFVGVNDGTYFNYTPEESTSKEVIDEEKLQKIVEYYEARSKRFNQLTSGMSLSSFSEETENSVDNENEEVDNISTTTLDLSDNIEEREEGGVEDTEDNIDQ